MENTILYVLKINILATICICMVLLISRLVKRRYSARWRYIMWILISLFLVVPFGLFPQMEVINLGIPNQNEIVTSPVEDPDTSGEDAAEKPDMNVLPAEAEEVSGVDEAEPARSGNGIGGFTLFEITRMMMFIWIGVAIMVGFLRVLLYQVSVRSLRRWATARSNQRALEVYCGICNEKKGRKFPKLMMSSKLQSPMLVGLINSTLYLPEADYTDAELRLIFQHELCHYENKHLWYKFFLLIVNTIYWFNPFLYLMRKEAEKDIEYICDSVVVSECPLQECTMYQKLILKTAENHCQGHYVSASLNDDMTNFKERMWYMMKEKSLKKGNILVILCVVSLIFSNLLVGCSTKKAKEQETDPNVSTEQSDESETAEEDSLEQTEAPKETEDPSETSKMSETSDSSEESEDNAEATNEAEIDKSGDYLGTIPSPLPPKDSSYRICNKENTDENIVLYVTNIDDANFKFYIMKAIWIGDGVESDHMSNVSEDVIFLEHVAHYNGDGYYEYIGKDYHLYFKYDEGLRQAEGDYGIEVYGLEKLFNQSQYGEVLYYNGISGTKFTMGLPFAG